ncbi:leucine-rich repeat receptor-like serine/threonine-protein kinase [Pyrus ussuriensis x Pyrus communis]|uniref:Leucine-rich repeat receptor-like serine/threonine-protein kinase n=1 Tax=Pyrus ussuriensis x Pyrus communis TaxID=2448454 RepID=A0A5N5HM30_9ROSA|nr:leucine-rich repeat receptor-like serine/threonine-protein kinase [Pyrus ussuriensis x Pyrus communis]
MLVRVDETSYDGVSIGQNYILVNYGRFSCGAESSVRSIITINSISDVDQAPNYFPAKLYQSAEVVEGEGVIVYELPVDVDLDYFLWLHFAEIDPGVTEAGQTVFDVLINGECHSD